MKSNNPINSIHALSATPSHSLHLAALFTGLALAAIQQPAVAAEINLNLISPRPLQLAPSIVSANELLGREVRAWNVDGQTVGKVNDALFDTASGQMVALLASSAQSSQLTPMPANLCIPSTMDAHAAVIVLCTAPGFNGAPHLSKNAGLNPDTLAASFGYFGQTTPGILGTTSDRQLASATHMIGQQVLSREGEALGRVQDITFDMVLRKAVFVVIQPSVGAHRSTDYYAVPPSALQTGSDANQLVLNVSQATFLAGTHFPKVYSAELAQPQLAAAVYTHYGNQTSPWASFGPTTPATGATTSTGTAIPASPTGRSDAEISSAFLVEFNHTMPAPNSPAHDAAVRDGSITRTQVKGIGTIEVSNSNIAATPRGGRLILTGIATSENQRRQFVAAASRVVGADNVDDQITLR
jgi:sporulation protein YlmC with PRC-barrel domain